MSAPSTPERNPQRVLDARLHTALTGQAVEWVRHSDLCPSWPDCDGVVPRLAEPCTPEGVYGWKPVPDYSDSWEGMGLVIEAMRTKGWRFASMVQWTTGEWHACFDTESLLAEHVAPTAPEAVAKAALAERRAA